MVMSFFGQNFAKASLRGMGIPFLILIILSMLILPLPSVLLDVFFTLNIVIGLVIIMIAINVTKPLEFSAFPSILLLATMLRLSLNVASTRVILVDGHNGPGAAGKVIESFGQFLIAGNYAVGFIIFAILMIINFAVVTKGAGRVSEVIARFTLDAMPGKQMAIDADLNAGMIDQETAKARREEVSQESDFFGSMDGASKFVRGDAIAGILILVINIIGGLVIGMTQHQLSLGEAGEIYVLLTIGDGLVAQIPSLLLSLSTAIIVTRVTTSENMSRQTSLQLANPQALFIASAILFTLGIIPGMPHIVFLLFSAVAGGLGYGLIRQKNQLQDQQTEERNAGTTASESNDLLGWDDIEQSDIISLELGYGLVALASQEGGGTLLGRIRGVRKKLSAELGFLLQSIRVRDNLELPPDVYKILLRGIARGKGEIKIGHDLAINPGNVSVPLDAVQTKDPAFGLDAYWILPAQRDYARMLGYTVVDAATAIATHVNMVLKDNAQELLGHEETHQLLDKVTEKAPQLMNGVVPDKLTLATVNQVLKNLIAEDIPLRDMSSIVESMAAESHKTKDPDELTALVRPSLGRFIMQSLVELGQTLSVITLESELEHLISNTLLQSRKSGELVMDPKLAENLFNAIDREKRQTEDKGLPAVLIVSPGIRPWLAKAMRNRSPGLRVLAYTEIPEDQDVKVIAKIGLNADSGTGNNNEN
jgi:flagellar biosynthesis protein FlhA